MKGLTVAKPAAPYELTSDIEKPTPGPKQVLVKSLYTGINQVYVSTILFNSHPLTPRQGNVYADEWCSGPFLAYRNRL
jgi:hypothetical protein